MKIATTTGDLKPFVKIDDQLSRDIQILHHLHEAGFRYVDLSMYSFNPSCIYMSDDWHKAAVQLKEEADRLGMTFVQAHSQGGNCLCGDPEKVDFIIRATIRSIEICQVLGIANTVVHPGCAYNLSKEEWFDKNRDFYRNFFPAMEATGVNVLIENSAKAIAGERYWASTGSDMREFLSYADHPLLHACWDTGHGHCNGNQYEQITTLGDELYAIHYNDNHGLKDEHLIPFFGTMNHDEVIHALIDSNFKGYFTLEASSCLIPKVYWLGGRTSFEKDERLVNPPAFMQLRLEQLLYETAKYMLEAYGIFEE